MTCIRLPKLNAIACIPDHFELLDNNRRKCPYCKKRTKWFLEWGYGGPSLWCASCDHELINWYDHAWALAGVKASQEKRHADNAHENTP